MKKILTIAFIIMYSIVSAQKTYIQCGKLIDVMNQKVLSNMTIVVDKNKVIDVLNGFATPSESDAKIIDLRTKTVMPGLIDMHVHIESQTSPTRYIDGFTLNPPDIAFDAARYAQISLLCGFTSVRDLGGSGVNISLRNAIAKNKVIGPRIFTAGKTIATTGGHGDPTNGYRKDLMGNPGPTEGVVNGVDDCMKAVRQRYKDGSDLIKITATGGVLSNAKNSSNPQFTEDEIKAIVQIANDYGFKVAAHAHGAEGMKRAIRAGVSSIEHGTLMDDETIALMKQYGTYYVPTIIAGKSVADSATKNPTYFPELVRPKALEIGPQIQKTFAKAYKSGVKIAFGTDAGVFAHGNNWLEFVYMTEAGMPILEALKSATVNAADLLGMSEQLGTIEKNKLADIIAFDDNPVDNIKTLAKPCFVMKNGVVYKN
ncbi:MAG: amidohydrolase family protein [Alphaproteobacteria bacterium]|nr:amidohydrolase family protein [Alphaproteobacteria bacterium]